MLKLIYQNNKTITTNIHIIFLDIYILNHLCVKRQSLLYSIIGYIGNPFIYNILNFAQIA